MDAREFELAREGIEGNEAVLGKVTWVKQKVQEKKQAMPGTTTKRTPLKWIPGILTIWGTEGPKTLKL